MTERGYYDLLSVNLGWVKTQEGGKCKDLTRVALSFLDFKNREILCAYKPHLSLKEFLLYLHHLKIKSTVLLDIPLKGKTNGFFRPIERVMQRIGIPCRPSKNALIKGRRLLLKIKALGFKAIEIYPYEFYKFFYLLPQENLDSSRKPQIDPLVFRRSFPPYKRAGEKGLKNAEKIIKQLLDFLRLKLIPPLLKGDEGGLQMKWDIYDSLFGVIAGYLLLKHSPWIKIIKDKTGSEILILSDVNLGHFFGEKKNFGN